MFLSFSFSFLRKYSAFSTCALGLHIQSTFNLVPAGIDKKYNEKYLKKNVKYKRSEHKYE